MKHTDGKLHVARWQRLKGERYNFESLWQQTADVLWPDAADFLTTHRQPGERRTQKVFDSTPALALDKFVAAQMAMLTPKAQKWHGLRATDESLNRSGRVQEYFDYATKVLFDLRGESRFYGEAAICYRSDGAFGNSCLLAQAHPRRVISYQHVPIRELCIAVDDAGWIDTIYREVEMTARQAEMQWGENLPGQVRDKLEREPDSRHCFLRCVYPNPDYDPESMHWAHMRYRAADIYPQDASVIEESGYHELPYIYSRFAVNPLEVYGRGPASVVLPDVFTLQEMEKQFMRAGERTVSPPLFLPNTGVLGAGSRQVNVRPNAINYGGVSADGRLLVHPMPPTQNLQWTIEMQEAKRTNVRAAFLETLWQILVDPVTMTATEALIRAQEKGQLLAPWVSMKQDEFLTPMIERELGLLERSGLLPPPPPELLEAEGEYRIVYESPATRMQELEEVTGWARTLEVMAPLAQLHPEIFENYDLDYIARYVAKANGMPQAAIRTEDALANIRQAQAQVAQQRDMMEALPIAAGAAKDMAQAERQAPPDSQVPRLLAEAAGAPA